MCDVLLIFTPLLAAIFQRGRKGCGVASLHRWLIKTTEFTTRNPCLCLDLHFPSNNQADTCIQISAHFRTFVVYSSGPESIVLLKQIETEDVGDPTPVLTGNAPLKPAVYPSLQYRSVISVVLGDYHYGALTSDGTLLTWGAFSKGAIGIGDPVDIEPGQPGGFNTREERLAVMDARAHMPFTPYVQEPTAVRFDHMLKSKGKKKFVFAATAAGWHSGALVIDLEVRVSLCLLHAV